MILDRESLTKINNKTSENMDNVGNDIIPALNARQQSEKHWASQNNIISRSKAISSVFYAVNAAIRKGAFECSLPDANLSDEHISFLKNLGYELSKIKNSIIVKW